MMRYINSKEIRSNPAVLWKEKETIVTSNGKPVAVVIRVDENVENTLTAFRQAKAMMAVEKLRIISKQKGLDKLNEEEIEKVIKEVRNESSH
ncbi:MAG: hypothetical protein PWP54_1012 [Thermosipho sp. (in: thermotogales)]|nr:hypothetical protein [Thermosipho sp. (in: thermotogales)]MDN5325091.1 hypothetical protein [Thermosipho sp. (in: thermotogales)]